MKLHLKTDMLEIKDIERRSNMKLDWIVQNLLLHSYIFLTYIVVYDIYKGFHSVNAHKVIANWVEQKSLILFCKIRNNDRGIKY